MEIEIIQSEPAPPPPVEVVLRMSADEARKLRTLMGNNGDDVWEAHHKLSLGQYITAAFPGYDEFAVFTGKLFHLISDADPSLSQPVLDNSRSY